MSLRKDDNIVIILMLLLKTMILRVKCNVITSKNMKS